MAQLEPQEWISAFRDLQEITGKVSASVTHEIKNQLTVIKEQASLLGDLALLAARTGNLDRDRVETLSGRMVDRVRQADNIVRRFNSFAHAADQPLVGMRAGEALELMVAMYGRLAHRQEVELELEPLGRDPELATRPQFLLAALFACLEAAAAAAPAGGRVSSRVEAAEDQVGFVFTWQGARQQESDPPAGPSPALLAVLGGSLESGEEALRLILPRSSPEGA